MQSGVTARYNYCVKTADVKGAYLNAIMKEKVLMKLNNQLTSILSEIDPTCIPFINDDGTIDVILDKALYGCVESGKLWYELISKHLLDIGYKKHPQDNCVFFRDLPKVGRVIICLYVDDLFIICPKEIEEFVDGDLKYLSDNFGQLTITNGNIHKYLGMEFDFSEIRKCKITMIQDIINLLNELKRIHF